MDVVGAQRREPRARTQSSTRFGVQSSSNLDCPQEQPSDPDSWSERRRRTTSSPSIDKPLIPSAAASNAARASSTIAFTPLRSGAAASAARLVKRLGFRDFHASSDALRIHERGGLFRAVRPDELRFAWAMGASMFVVLWLGPRSRYVDGFCCSPTTSVCSWPRGFDYFGE